MNGRMYDPLLGRMLSPDPYVPDPYFSQDYNRYSYARNNPLVYVDPDGESILIASIIIGAIVGAYIGGSAANNTLDPTMWEWDSKDTWIGMGIGGVVGAVGGWGFAAAAPAVAGTSFFSYFGASGTVAAYGLVGTAAGGAVGYGAGFGSALYSSGGDWSYANQMGGIMSGVGAQIGSLAGMAAGGWAAYGTKLAQAGVEAAATATAAKETAKEAAITGSDGVNRIYSARELLRRTAEPGTFHNFPELFNQTIFSQGTKTVTPNFFRVAKPGLSNTSIMYELPGTINGTNGVFQIGVRPSVSGNTELIIHRFFKPY